MDKQVFIQLLDRYLEGNISEEEKALVEEYYRRLGAMPGSRLSAGEEDALNEIMLDNIRAAIREPEKEAAPVRRLRAVRKWYWAAAVLLVLAGSWFLWQGTQREQWVQAGEKKTDVLPGKQGAILTLADGSQMVLDSLGNGMVANQHGVKVVLQNGQLAYAGGDKSLSADEGKEDVVYNVLSTPKGRQFQLMLPDGSKVWLNAASSIRYPVVFNGRERRVEITGEAYFEITHASRSSAAGALPQAAPFIVQTNKQQVQVLGTSFNINAYDNEEAERTTLIEGAVRVAAAGLPNYILKPGQQARIDHHHSPALTIQTAEVDQVTAWKNGIFNFNDTGLEELMRQLERWYNIEVRYEEGIPDLTFGGELSRNSTLTDVLTALETTKVHFRLEEGRRLVVLP